MIKIALCDDNKAVIAELEEYLYELNISNISFDFFYSGGELLDYMERNCAKYQIYFLDISMPQITGIETAEKIRESDRTCIIIFLTDYQEFVYQVFRALPFRFLRKPVDKITFRTVLHEAFQHLKVTGNFFFFKIEREYYQIPYADILFFEAQKRKVRMVTLKDSYLFYRKISDISKEIADTLFVQCHASYLVNMEQLHSLNEKSLIIRNGEQLPISKKYRDNVRKKYLEYVKWSCGK